MHISIVGIYTVRIRNREQVDTAYRQYKKLNIKYPLHLPQIVKCAVHCQPLLLVTVTAILRLDTDTEVNLSWIRLLFCGERQPLMDFQDVEDASFL